MKCRKIIHAENLGKMILQIRRIYGDYCSVYFPICMDFTVPLFLVLWQEVMKCRKIFHAEKLAKMVLQIRRIYGDYCSVYLPICMDFTVPLFLVL
jgi:hypothetical protein